MHFHHLINEQTWKICVQQNRFCVVYPILELIDLLLNTKVGKLSVVFKMLFKASYLHIKYNNLIMLTIRLTIEIS